MKPKKSTTTKLKRQSPQHPNQVQSECEPVQVPVTAVAVVVQSQSQSQSDSTSHCVAGADQEKAVTCSGSRSSAYDGIICTIGQKIPESLAKCESDSYYTSPAVAVMNHGCDSGPPSLQMAADAGDDNNYYEKMYEIDLNSSSSRSRSSSTTSEVDVNVNVNNANGSAVLLNGPNSGANGNLVTCSISSTQAWNNEPRPLPAVRVSKKSRANPVVTVASSCPHGCGKRSEPQSYDYSEPVDSTRCSQAPPQPSPPVPLRPSTRTRSFTPTALPRQQLPIPNLTILNPDGSVRIPNPAENELDSLDLTLFEKKRVDAQQQLQLLGHNDTNHRAMSPSSLLRAATKKVHAQISAHTHNHGTAGSSGSYWMDAGNEFEFISAASVLKNANANKCQIGVGVGRSSAFAQSAAEEESHYSLPAPEPVCVLSPCTVPNCHCGSSLARTRTTPICQEVIMEEGYDFDDCDRGSSTRSHSFGKTNSGSGSGRKSKSSTPAVTLRSVSASSSMQYDTSYDKAIGSGSGSVPMSIQQLNKRRGSLPLTMTSGIVHDPANDQSTNTNQSSTSSSLSSTSRLVNFFAKRSFKVSSGNPLNRARSASKLDPKILNSATSNVANAELEERRNSQSQTPPLSSNSDPAAQQLVNAQSLHPSVINNQHGFVTTSADGTTQYYSCKTRAERDTWLRHILESIHHPEKPRVENSFQIWILEGKDIGKPGQSKRYHCEIHLDDKLYGRTSGKIKDELLFWGEEFIFNELQVSEATEAVISVWRRDATKKNSGKTKKKEKKEMIGTVKLPLKNLQSRQLVEKWYPLNSEASSAKLKPTLRIKCKFEAIQILPISSYLPLVQFVEENYVLLCEHLEPFLSVKGKEDLADALINVLHHQSIAKRFVADLALREILRGGDDKLTFRGNSIATKAMESYLKLLGSNYLDTILGPFIEQFQNCDLYDCEVDPMRIQQITHLPRNQSNLRMCVDNIWHAILDGLESFPVELEECFSYCRQELKDVGREELCGHLISASVFLRFLCPAILSPSLFRITTEYPSERSARNLMLIAKVMQTLANFTRFQGKESYMEFINDYVEKEAENMANFLLKISAPVYSSQLTSAPTTTVDFGRWLSVLTTLLSDSIDKIANKTEEFRTLEDILRKLQPLQQVTSSAPTSSPPPPPMVTTAQVGQTGTLAYAIGNVISQSAIPVHMMPHLRSSGQSPEPQTNSSGYQSQSPVMTSYTSTPLNFSNPAFNRGEAVMGLETPQKAGVDIANKQQRLKPTPASTQMFSSSSGSDDDDSYENVTLPHNAGRLNPKRPITNPLLRSQQHFKSTAALELHRSSHPVHSASRHLSSSDSDSGIANHNQSSRTRKMRFTNRRSPDGCPEPVETKSLEEYEHEMAELRQAMELLQAKLNRAEERIFNGHQPHLRPRSSAVANPAEALLPQDKRLSTASARELEIEGLLQRLLSAEEEMKREQELLSALDQKQKLIDAQEQKITHLDTVNTQLITALSKIHSSLQQQRQPDSTRPKSSLPTQMNDIVNNNNTSNNSTIVTISTGGEPAVIRNDLESRRSMSPDSLNGAQAAIVPGLPPKSATDPNQVVIGEEELKLLADLKSSAC